MWISKQSFRIMQIGHIYFFFKSKLNNTYVFIGTNFLERQFIKTLVWNFQDESASNIIFVFVYKLWNIFSEVFLVQI
jgi:hypothetical protein